VEYIMQTYIIAILIVVLIVLLYFFYSHFNSIGKQLTANANLNNGSTNLPLSDNASNFAFSVWIYVNAWDNTPIKPLVSRVVNGATDPTLTASPASKNYSYSLYLDRNAPNLYFDVKQSTSTAAAATSITPPILVTSNFPIQTWCCVTISLDSNYVDCYINGKLVKSVLLNSPVDSASIGNNKTLLVGSSTKSDIFLSNLYYSTSPISPAEAWKQYTKGSNKLANNNILASYGLGLSFFKNNVQQSSVRLF